jgi:hypothetical protein
MAFVLFLVVGTMIYMKKTADSGAARKKDRPGAGQIEYKVSPAPGPDPAGTPPAAQDPTLPSRKDIPLLPVPAEGRASFRELASPFRDGEEPLVKETPEFVNLINVFLNSVSAEELRKRVNPAMTAELAYRDPARHRGEVVRCYGPLIQIYTERLDATTPNNVEFVYLGVMQEYPSNRTVYFYMPEKPKDPVTGAPVEFKVDRVKGHEFIQNWVEVEGVFLRTYVYPSQYENEQGKTAYARSSVLFVKNLKLSRKPEMADPRGSFVFLVGGLAVAIAAIIVVAGVMTRKYNSGSLRMKMFVLRRTKRGDAAVLPPPDPARQVLGEEVPRRDPPP